MSLPGEELPFSLQSQAAPEQARPTAVIDQAVALDPHRVFTFSLLDGNIAGHVSRVAQPIVSIPVRAPPPGPRQQLIVDIGRLVLSLAANDDQGIAAFTSS